MTMARVTVAKFVLFLLCLLPAVGAGQAAPLLALALGLLAWSFAVDVRWRYVNGRK